MSNICSSQLTFENVRFPYERERHTFDWELMPKKLELALKQTGLIVKYKKQE